MDRPVLQSLGYMGVETANVADWRDFNRGLLGMDMRSGTGNGLFLRTDERAARLFVEQGSGERVSFMGWEVADAAALEAIGRRIEDSGYPVAYAAREFVDRRMVAGMLVTGDPLGNRLELFHGAAAGEDNFQPGRSLSGFRTGGLGLGHVVLTARSADAVIPFYRDVLGFRLSDYALRPFRAFFFHLNSRHHSFAIVETGTDGFHHLMVELNALDDVGQAYDLAQLEEERVAVTLGRHSNDYMTSFYMRTPSKFMIEYGWGGRSIEPGGWQATEYIDGPSLWGHERSWLPPEKRQEALDLRLRLAAKGERAPDYVRSDGARPTYG